MALVSDQIVMPKNGKLLSYKQGKLVVPNNPIIPFIEGDGIGIDVTPVMKKVVDAAVKKAYQGDREIHWLEVYAGEKAVKKYGPDNWLPDETLSYIRKCLVLLETKMMPTMQALQTHQHLIAGLRVWVLLCLQQ